MATSSINGESEKLRSDIEKVKISEEEKNSFFRMT